MKKREWANTMLDNLIADTPGYEERSLLRSMKLLINEQYKRIDQKEAEIDGRSWNPKKW